MNYTSNYKKRSYRTYSRRRGYSGSYTELKAVDVTNTNITVGVTGGDPSTGGFVDLLNGMTQGVGSFTRVGIQTNPKSVRARGSVAPNASTTFPGPFARIAIVFDRAPQDALPSYNDIFQGYNAAGVPVFSGSVSPNPSYSHRFLILRDWQFQLGFVNNNIGNTVYSSSPAQATIDEWVSTYDRVNKQILTTQYKQGVTTTTVDSISTGALYYVYYNSGAPGTLNFSFSYRTSVKDQ